MIDVCKIFAGYTVRSGLQPAATAGVHVAQLGDIRGGRPVHQEDLGRFENMDLPERFMAGAGDVLFRSKGEPTTAAVVAGGPDQKFAVMQPLMILRPRQGVILSDFLAWSINRMPAQRYFRAAAQGTTIRTISKSTLESLPVEVPSLDIQEKMASAYHLAMCEADLLRDLAEKSEQITTLSLEKYMEKEGTRA